MGLHDHTYLFGKDTHEIERVLQHFWDASTKAVSLNTLDEMGVLADEQPMDLIWQRLSLLSC